MLKNLSKLERLVAGGFILSLLSFPLVVLLTLQEANENEMEKHTVEISTAITRLRQFYASDVVGRIQDANGKTVISENYKDIHGGIPIPATFSIEIGQVFNQAHQDTKLGYAFVSDYPFTSRQRPPLDEFQQRALFEFRKNPELKIYKESHVPLIGDARYRLATPVYMQPACIYCHNGHPASTKTDWKANDIRGIQEVSVGSIDTNFYDFRYLFAYFVLISALAAGSMLVFRQSANRLRAANADLQSARETEEKISAELKQKVDQLVLLGAVADRSTFGVTIADCRKPDLPLIYANEAFYRMTGLTEDQVIGNNCRFMTGPLTSQEARSGIREAIAKGLPHTVELINYKKDGVTFWNRLTLFPVGGTPGKPDFYVGYQIDVTAARDAEEERAAMLAEIQEGQKLESLGILVAGVSHEINNPLGIALTATSHIAQNADALRASLEAQGVLTDKVREFLEDEKEAFELVESNLKRAAGLVRNFKEVATDRAQKSIRQVNLKSYLQTLGGSFTPLLRRTRAKLTIESAPNIETILDTGSFGQLITNLVVNATTHAFDGIKHPEIKITATQADQHVLITVCDNGNGIPANVLPNIFAPFFTTKRGSGGTGLGLFIAKRIANDDLQGDLTVENKESGGACFRLTFPIKLENDE